MHKHHSQVTRRWFMKRSALAAAAVASCGPTIVPSSVLGANPPSETVTMGMIGTGMRGSHVLAGFLADPRTQCLAACDVDSQRRGRAKQTIDQKNRNKDCREYADFRELLGRGDIDVVHVPTPPHWHAVISIAAAQAGCDIWCRASGSSSTRSQRPDSSKGWPWSPVVIASPR